MLANALKTTRAIGVDALNSSQRRAVSIIEEIFRGRAKAPLAGIQGPPGTGKTSVVEAFAKDYVADWIGDHVGEVIIYVAPTNHLAAQAFERVASALLARGYTLRDIISMVRVYGSKITVKDCGKVLKSLTGKSGGLSEELLKDITYGPVDPHIVRIVFTTEYQRVSGRFTSKPERVHLIVDEASKTPFYRPFITIVDSIMRYKDYAASMSVLGDPEQAITIPEVFRLRSVDLLMDKVMRLLKKNDLMKSNFVMLDTTYRLPGPSEKPISHGFYDDKLQAFMPAKQRLKDLRDLFIDLAGKVRSKLEIEASWGSRMDRLFGAIYNAASSGVPLVVVETPKFRGESYASTYDAERARLALHASLIFGLYARLARETGEYPIPSIMAIAPYSDIEANIAFNFKRLYGNIAEPPMSATVHAVIGGEADIVVSVLGKEYDTARGGYVGSDDLYSTVYYNEPQVLNVQLSRHYRMMVVIGSTRQLASAHSYRTRGRGVREVGKIARTASMMKRLVDDGKAIEIPIEY
ncbi:hypothetical protein CF15_05350 [Pyrodictium occultum]|uniref:Uncharacterized protein n=1 Tax=Pyrodictium occultum TaxID=2309 RepID=A0A0V8RVU3_PYROC|nr:hypothetical protein CF15_05350 [Pyrodictium occultum]